MTKLFDILFKGKSGMWTAIFTGVLTVFTYYLWDVAEKTGEMAVSTQRAFISAGGNLSFMARVVRPEDKGKVSQLQTLITWENSGSTPTKTGLTVVSFQPWDKEQLPDGFGFPDTGPKNPIVIPPKGTGATGIPVPIGYLQDVRDRKNKLFVWGAIVYEDIFPNTPKRLTEFCFKLFDVSSSNPDMSDTKTNIKWSSDACTQHNCYDENCPDYKERVTSILK
jgi:hypothetical protein